MNLPETITSIRGELMNLPLWFCNLAFWTAQSALLVVAAGLLPRLLQVRQPRVRLAYWRVLLAIALALPWLQPWHRAHAVGAITIAPGIAGASVTAAPGPTVTHTLVPGIQAIPQIAGVIILIGIAVRLVTLALGLLKLRHFRRTSLPIPSASESAAVFEAVRSQVNARAEFRLSRQVDSPVTFGFSAPVILLPERVISMNQQAQAAIACHELVHVRRHDWAQHLAEEAIRGAFWFHPAVAWLIGRVRLAREQVVDLEVIRLTNARKTYLEALLEFASNRPFTAAIPAPPFLVERQLAERVALMLKEVRMSPTRLVTSLAVIACCLTLVATLAARAFPLQGPPLAAQPAPAGGITQGVTGGVAGGVAQGIPGGVRQGVSGGVTQGAAGGVIGKKRSEVDGDVDQGTTKASPAPDISHIWIDTVKQGPMVRQVRGLGKLVREDSGSLLATVQVPEEMTAEVKLNQSAVVDTHKGLVGGHVIRIGPAPSNGTRSVDIALDDALPSRSGAGLSIDGIIEIEKLDNVLYVGRPVFSVQNTTTTLFKLVNDGAEAVRVKVKLGRASVSTIEVLDGLSVGDQVIVSDTSGWDGVDRIRLK
jgi:beta-lactamase regulating signal transducer with metallopeptidase domain